MYDLTGKRIGDGGRYELGELLGSGAMGLVYKAVDHRLRRAVVIKLLSPSLTANEKVRQRFASEALIQANLLHPNVVRAVDWIDTPEIAGIVIDFVDGPSLEQHLASVGRLSPRDAVALLQPALSAVGLAHEHGVVHRDLKPANILLDATKSTFVPKVADFGIAKILGQDGAGMTRQGAVLGTPAYMPPEQLRGLVDEIDHTADIYALGVIFHQMLSGEMPYEAQSEYEVTHQVLSGHTLRPLSGELPGVTPHLDHFIARATAHDKSHRFVSCDEMGRALNGALDARSTAPTPSAAGPQPFIRRPQQDKPASRTPRTMYEGASGVNETGLSGDAAPQNHRRFLLFGGGAAVLLLVGVVVGLSASGGTPPATPSGPAVASGSSSGTPTQGAGAAAEERERERQRAEAEARRRAEEDATRRRREDEARKSAAEEERRRAEEERRRADVEARRSEEHRREQAQQDAFAAYRRMVSAYNRRDDSGYYAGYADPMDCFYNGANYTTSMLRGKRGNVATSTSYYESRRLQLYDATEYRVRFYDHASLRRASGDVFPFTKALIMEKRGGRWQVTSEAGSSAHGCLVGMPASP